MIKNIKWKEISMISMYKRKLKLGKNLIRNLKKKGRLGKKTGSKKKI